MSFLRIDATEWWGLRRRSSSVSWRFLGNNQSVGGRISTNVGSVDSSAVLEHRPPSCSTSSGVDRSIASCHGESALAFELFTTLMPYSHLTLAKTQSISSKLGKAPSKASGCSNAPTRTCSGDFKVGFS